MLDPIIIADPVTTYRTSINSLIGDKPLDAAPVLDVGLSGQVRAGRQLAVADFTTLLGLSTPVGLFNLGDLTNLGSGGNLVNKGTVAFGPGITGAATEAAIFTGSSAKALYVADTGGSDPFRIRTGSWGCWFKTAKFGSTQSVMAKKQGAGNSSFALQASNSGATAWVSVDGTNLISATATVTPKVINDRWHFAVATWDGATLALYMNGALAATAKGTGPIFSGTAPVNIGGYGADGGTVASEPHFGRADEAFITADVLSPDQVRLLYAVKVPHDLGIAPEHLGMAVIRRRKGGPLLSADFPAQPVRLHNFTAAALTDQGSGAVSLTNNNAAVSVAGADGAEAGAFGFVAASTQYLSSTDTGLPTGATTRTFGCWFKVAAAAANFQPLIGYGTQAAGPTLGISSSSGTLRLLDGGGGYDTGIDVCDGRWHFAAAVSDNSAADGVKIKIYLDDGLVYSVTFTQGTATLIGAGGFRIGRSLEATTNYLNGAVDGAFVAASAYTSHEIAALYAKGCLPLPASPKNPGDHIEAKTATDLYLVCDTLQTQHQIDLRVAA